MDEILTVVGLSLSGDHVVVELESEDNGTLVSLRLTADKAKTFQLGRTWRNRVTRSSQKQEEG